jgi:aminoglycoside N3'-acetyltransferase
VTWEPDHFKQTLKQLKIGRGSKIFVHSNLAFLGKCAQQNKEPVVALLDIIESVVTSRGAIYFPAFTYTWGDDRVFEPFNSIGIDAMGALSLEAFKRGYLRSVDPMFSVLGFGSLTENFIQSPRNCSFGEGSLFGQLVDENITLLLIGTGGGTTLLHEIERRKKVPYRHDKAFKCHIRLSDSSKKQQLEWNSYVRELSTDQTLADFRRLTLDLRANGIASTLKFGKTSIFSYSIAEVSVFVSKMMEYDPYYLTLRGWKNSIHEKETWS